jgi:hypothetical protein
MLESGGGKCRCVFRTGVGELRVSSSLPIDLSILRSYLAVNHPVGGKRLGKSCDTHDLGSKLSVSPSNNPHTDGRQALSLLTTIGPEFYFYSNVQTMGHIACQRGMPTILIVTA